MPFSGARDAVKATSYTVKLRQFLLQACSNVKTIKKHVLSVRINIAKENIFIVI